MATKITFRSRKDAVNVYAENKEQAEQALSNYLGSAYGGLEMNERANADKYFAANYDGAKRGIELIRTESCYTGKRDEVFEIEVGLESLAQYLC